MRRIIFLLFLSLPLVAFSESKKEIVSEKTQESKSTIEGKEKVAKDEKAPVIIDADSVGYVQEKGKVVARGNVVMRQKDVELFCDEGEFDANSNIAHLKGNVKIIKYPNILYGENVIYDFNTYDAEMINIRIEDAPIYGQAKEGNKQGEIKYILRDGYITTCDLNQPHYRLVSKRITIYPQDKVVAKNMILMIGKIPVFYFPYYTQALDSKSPPVELVPGKADEFGYYTLGRYRYELMEGNRGRLHLDGYEKRGWAFGVSHKMESKFGKALLKYVQLQDKMYEIDKRNSLFAMYPERSSTADKYLEDDRYRAELSYSWDPLPKVSIRGEFHKFSDDNYMKDFYEKEYEVDPTPSSYILATYSLNNSSLSLLAKKRVNRYSTQTEYLPQLEYNFFQQNLGLSKLYLESNDKLGNLTYKRKHSASDDDVIRLYSDNTLHYTDKIKWLSINPYVGGYTSFYSKNKFGDEGIWRTAFKTGVTLNVKLYKVFDKKWKIFGEEMDKIRHVLTPRINYDYVHEPTVSDDNLFQFDENDSLSRTENVSFTLDNKLQAKNKERTWDFVYFSPSFNYRINPEGGGSHFESITANFEFYPKEGLSLTSDTYYDVPSRRFTSFNADLTLKGFSKVLEGGKEVKKEKYSFSYGHRYTRVSDVQGILDLNWQITPKVHFRSYWRYEYNRDDLKEQQYKISTDMHCWWLDFGLDIKRPSVGGKNYTFWFEFRLKAFPDLSVSFDAMQTNAKSDYYD